MTYYLANKLLKMYNETRGLVNNTVISHMKSKQEIIVEILRLWKISGADYGDNVVPVMKLYASLETSDERKLFQDALESLLSNEDEIIRRKAVTQCLGFFTFRDTI